MGLKDLSKKKAGDGVKVSMWECDATGTVRLHRRESPLKYTGFCLREVCVPVSPVSKLPLSCHRSRLTVRIG